jgi:sugar/nucleoside kinase (ribokinase family)
MKVLTIGGATQDIFLQFDNINIMKLMQESDETSYFIFETGEKIEVDNLTYHTGGGATNSATSFSRLGFDASCFCAIGDDPPGKHVLDDIAKENIDSSAIVTIDHPTARSFIIHAHMLDRTIFVHRGANKFLPAEKIPFDLIEKSDQIYITSLSEKASYLLTTIVKHAKQHSVPVAINPGSSQLSHGANVIKESLPYIDVIIMNNSEAKLFMISLIESDETYKKALKSRTRIKTCPPQSNLNEACLLIHPILYENYFFSTKRFFNEVLKMGPKIVVITNGANGVYVANPQEILFHPSIKTSIVDTVGAGDAFGSCFVASLAQGKTVEEALRRGMINSSSVISKLGTKAGLLTEQELAEKEKNIPRNLIERFTL